IGFGRSLGAAVALHVALRYEVGGLILEGAFEGASAVARRAIPFLPVWFLMRNRFDSVGRIRRLRAPLLMIHGAEDRLIPIEQGRALFELAQEPKEFYVVEGAGHDDTDQVGGESYAAKVQQFCRRCAAPRPEAAP
ncbi:MAG: alpha/beta hydrolase, partial [Planctomycetota bacterium]